MSVSACNPEFAYFTLTTDMSLKSLVYRLNMKRKHMAKHRAHILFNCKILILKGHKRHFVTA